MAMDAPPSQTDDPVTSRRVTPAAAKTRPTTAALSSNSATLTVMSGLDSTWSRISSWLCRASPRTCTNARTNEVPSAMNATPRAA